MAPRPPTLLDRRTPFFGKQAFTYDPQADPATCQAWPLKPKWTESSDGRMIRRSFDEDVLDRVRAYHQTKPVQERDAEAEGLGGTVVWRGQSVARVGALSLAGLAQGEY